MFRSLAFRVTEVGEVNASVIGQSEGPIGGEEGTEGTVKIYICASAMHELAYAASIIDHLASNLFNDQG